MAFTQADAPELMRNLGVMQPLWWSLRETFLGAGLVEQARASFFGMAVLGLMTVGGSFWAREEEEKRGELSI